MSSSQFRAALSACPLIAILRGLTPQEAPAVGRVLWDAGFRILEVPLNSPRPFDSISALREALPDALIGAGTVLELDQITQLQAAGGQLMIAPNFNLDVVRAAKQAGMLAIPGVATPTEAFAALAAGADAIKLFPAEMISPAAMKAMRAVLPKDALLLPVGGISAANMAAYIQAGANGFGIGSSLYSSGKELLKLQQDAINFIASCADSMTAKADFSLNSL
ncbi:2-dehydro-3-deoxy-6-phosphogalactonate aldolase [Variovorax sp. PCZ-1]|uniref:2-dehydro-3-deoxy-6-phosphogalactonate aldolase n=1 Tax=Variovorax sp. PCZ-1 TaxID=2835533 RepID=UPI001BCE3B57|nr:2-dehydro-3-deoxy-6-phosphogalactonate aldolase [Variovorax sp. PCZ-1]MBS7808014.1 2-dehydro-3-deoxy-6-phosphogalactonate aldolase [Variovorax sp. PCZ-1]